MYYIIKLQWDLCIIKFLCKGLQVVSLLISTSAVIQWSSSWCHHPRAGAQAKSSHSWHCTQHWRCSDAGAGQHQKHRKLAMAEATEMLPQQRYRNQRDTYSVYHNLELANSLLCAYLEDHCRLVGFEVTIIPPIFWCNLIHVSWTWALLNAIIPPIIPSLSLLSLSTHDHACIYQVSVSYVW